MSLAPPNSDQVLERGAKRASWLWAYVLFGFTLIGAGWSTATLVLAWKLDAVNAQLTAIRADQHEIRVALDAERLTRNEDRARLVRLETTVRLMPIDELAATRREPKRESR